MDRLATLLSLLTPLFAVPLTVFVFYLRSLREQQATWQADTVRRLDGLEHVLEQTRQELGLFERDYATKEEWLRECMLARRRLDELSEKTIRMETTILAAKEAPAAGRRVERRTGSRGVDGDTMASDADWGG